jgi:hypothetical protein
LVSSDEINKRLNERREKKIITPYESSSDFQEKTRPLLRALCLWFLGISLILLSLIWGMTLQIMFLMWGAFIIVIGIFNLRGYFNKTYLLILMGMVISSGLFSLWYLIKTGYSYDADFIYMVGIFMIMSIIMVIVYLSRENDPTLIWKDEWGF